MIIELLSFSQGIRIWNLHQSQRKNIIEIDPKTTKLCFKCLKWTYGRCSIDYRVASLFTGYSDLESPSNFIVKEKKVIEIDPETTKLCFD